jgi:hypothetical protein
VRAIIKVKIHVLLWSAFSLHSHCCGEVLNPSLNPDESAKHPARFRSPRSGMKKPKRVSQWWLFSRAIAIFAGIRAHAQALSAVAHKGIRVS